MEEASVESSDVFHRAYKFRLDPTTDQLAVLRQQAGAARAAYNLMCAYNLTVEEARRTRCEEITATGLDSTAAWEKVKEEAKANDSLKILSYQGFSSILTREVQRHREAAQEIAAGADPTRVWGEEERYDAPWMHTVNRRVLNSGLQQCGKAFLNWLASRSGQRQGKEMGLPRFKSKRRARDSFTVPVPEAMGPKGFASYKLGEGRSGELADYRHVRLSHLGTFRTFDRTKRLVRALQQGGVLKSYTVSRAADRWYVSFLVECPAPEVLPQPTRRQRKAGAVGLDFGVLRLATLSTGEAVHNPRHLARAEKKIKRIQRKIARSQKGSARRKRLVERFSRQHHEVALRRRGFLNEMTSKLANSFAAIGIEDLNISGMTASARGTLEDPGKNVAQKAGLNRSILDASPGELRRQLTYKCKDRGVEIIAVDRFYPSSQICSSCGSRTKKTLDQRIYDCSCGIQIDRDFNAAINILREAARIAQDDDTSSAPEGAEGKWPWSPKLFRADHGSVMMSLGHRDGKAFVVTAVKQLAAHPR